MGALVPMVAEGEKEQQGMVAQTMPLSCAWNPSPYSCANQQSCGEQQGVSLVSFLPKGRRKRLQGGDSVPASLCESNIVGTRHKDPCLRRMQIGTERGNAMENNEVCDTNRLPLGLLEFSNIRKSNMIYVDKTKLLYDIASQRTPLFLSRPRRFGKSLLINTLHCLFESGLQYFQGLDIEKLWQDTTYKVVHLDFSSLARKSIEGFRFCLSDSIIDCFNSEMYDDKMLLYPDRVLNKILKKRDSKSIVLLIDEYDAPITSRITKPDELQEILDILSDFYAVIKQYTDKFRLIFITGITRTSHISIFSAFNNLVDISAKDEFNTLLGFTQYDIEHFFDPYIECAAKNVGMSKEDVYERLKQYYDGFQFSINAKETIYNPWSVLSFLKYSQDGFKNYWFKSSGSSTLIMQYLKNDTLNPFNYQGSNIEVSEDAISDRYEINSMPGYIVLLQAGYFTLRKKTSTVAQLTFPNTEVEESILNLYLQEKNMRPDIENYCNIDELIKNIDSKNLLYIVNKFNAILNDCVSSDSNIFNDERSIRDILYTALPQVNSLQKIKERGTVKGRADLEILTHTSHMVIEFKRTSPTRDAKACLEEAIEQIRSKRYGIGSFPSHALYRVAMVIASEEKALLPAFCQEVV